MHAPGTLPWGRKARSEALVGSPWQLRDDVTLASDARSFWDWKLRRSAKWRSVKFLYILALDELQKTLYSLPWHPKKKSTNIAVALVQTTSLASISFRMASFKRSHGVPNHNLWETSHHTIISFYRKRAPVKIFQVASCHQIVLRMGPKGPNVNLEAWVLSCFITSCHQDMSRLATYSGPSSASRSANVTGLSATGRPGSCLDSISTLVSRLSVQNAWVMDKAW